MFHFSFNGIRTFFKKMLKNVNSPYKLSLLNDISQEEVLQFQLTKKSVYIFFSSLFILLFLLYSGLIFFTPLKYYVPGSSQTISRKEMIKIKRLADSISKRNQIQEKFIADLLQITQGKVAAPQDSTRLSEQEMKQALTAINAKVDKAKNYDYLKVAQQKTKDSLSKAAGHKDNLLINDDRGK